MRDSSRILSNLRTHLIFCLRSGDNTLRNIPQVIGIEARNLLQAGTVKSLNKLARWVLELGRRDRDSPRRKGVQNVCHFHRRKLRLRLHLDLDGYCDVRQEREQMRVAVAWLT